MTATGSRVPALDGLRAIAIALVMLHHYTQSVPGASDVDAAWLAFTGSGWIGVDLFFVLSGMLITGILLDAKAANARNLFRAFYARRALRIFPVYYALLLVLYALPLLSIALEGWAAEQPAWMWLYGANLGTALHDWPHRPFAHLWSLAIEEHFYLVWPWIVVLCTRRALAVAIAAACALGIGLRAWYFVPGEAPTALYVLTWTRMDTLLIGAGVAWLLRSEIPRDTLARVFVALGSAAALATVFGLVGPRGLDWGSWGRFGQSFGYAAIAVAFAGLLGFVMVRAQAGDAPHPALVRALAWRPLVWLGGISYGLYLFHLPLEWGARQLGLHPVRFAPVGGAMWPISLAYVLGNAAVAIACAWLSWRVLETPVLRWKARVPYR